MKIINKNFTPAKINNFSRSYNTKKTSAIPQDKISFRGTIIKRVQSKEEIKEVLDLFYNSLKHNLEPNKKTPKFLEKIDRYLSLLPFSIASRQPNCITEVVKNENKLAGGYSMIVNSENCTAHIGFITLAPEYIKTKSGIEVLKNIGRRIYENANLNNVKEITLTTNSKNKSINNLLKRLGAEKVNEIVLGETKYKISMNFIKKQEIME